MTSAPAAQRQIDVMIVDDHPSVCLGMAAQLARDPGIRVVAVVGSVADVQRTLVTQEPQVMLLDHRLPDGNSFDVLTEVASMSGRSPAVVVMSAISDDSLSEAAARAGAVACIDKTVTWQELRDVVRTAAESGVTPQAGDATGPRLSPREREVLRLAAIGTTNREIAERLGISDETVKTHLDRIYSRLGVRDRTAAVNAAWKLGLAQF